VVRLPLFLFGLVVSLAVLANAFSRLVEKGSPELSLQANPLNTEASLLIGAAAVGGADRPLNIKTHEALKIANRLAPADARFFSLLGVVEENNGNLKSARRFYDHALLLLPTEYQALVRTLLQDLTNGKSEEAAAKAELIVRRWSNNWQIFEPYVAALADDDRGLVALERKFEDFPAGRRKIIEALVNENRNLAAAYKLILKWHGNGVTPLHWEVNRLGGAMIRQKQLISAYELFANTRSAAEKDEIGYIYNGSFNLPSTGNPFEWRIRKQSGVEVSTFRGNHTDGQKPEFGSYVNLRFLGNPLQLRNVAQWLRLPPGNYRLDVIYAPTELRTPKPLRVVIDCIGSTNRTAIMDLAQGTSAPTTESLTFNVPESKCLLSKIEINNEFVALSWHNKFEGQIRLYDVRIIRITG